VKQKYGSGGTSKPPKPSIPQAHDDRIASIADENGADIDDKLIIDKVYLFHEQISVRTCGTANP
jgi:metallophosphoesterase superfamily enzyme